MSPPSLSASILLIITHSHALNITLQVVTLMRGAPFQPEEAQQQGTICVIEQNSFE